MTVIAYFHSFVEVSISKGYVFDLGTYFGWRKMKTFDYRNVAG